jgi:hypothetical protein
MADAGDLKSPGRKAVRVQFPPPATQIFFRIRGFRRIANGSAPSNNRLTMLRLCRDFADHGESALGLQRDHLTRLPRRLRLLLMQG